MNTILRIALWTALFLYFGGIFYLLKKRLLELRYTLLWIFSGIVMMLIVIFPAAFERLMNRIGIIEATNGLFAVVLFLLLVILVSMTSALSKMNRQIKTLAQKFAAYEKRLRALEEKNEKESDDRSCQRSVRVCEPAENEKAEKGG